MSGIFHSRETGFLIGLILVLLVLAFPVRSQVLEDDNPSGRISLDYTQRFLSDEYSTQNVFAVNWLGYLSEQSDVSLFFEQASLFKETDQTLGGGYYWSPVPLVEFRGGGSYSSSHNIVPRTSSFLGTGFYPNRSVYLDLSASRTDYDTPLTESFSATFGWSRLSYELAYTVSVSRIEEGSGKYSHTLAYDYYSANGSRASVIVSGGQQPREVNEENTLTTEFYSISLSGFMPMDSGQSFRTAFVYGVTATRLMDEYDSLGFNVGIQREL